ncbi:MULTISPECIES: recombinase family protein [Bradyrhizobium]|uniref:recombinase family protein n=1 Tax=Bradyrhizobium TaxID=374 RepID=UPI002012D522|nr:MULTISPECIES: recombinase family protein [Bradyrhizobium]
MKKISACPGWLGLTEDRWKFVFLPERAEVVRNIFELAIGGMGSYAIANHLNREKIPSFGPSQTWDHTTIDSMLRNRATFGERQPKSYAGGSKKGVPVGHPVANYYPAAIDEATFNAAQAARRQNLISGRGRKGNNIANIFSKLATCAYCGSEIKFDSHAKSLFCSRVINDDGCTRTAWSYLDFELNVLGFLAHPALAEKLNLKQQEIMSDLVGLIMQRSDEKVYSARFNITLLLKEIISELSISSAGSEPQQRLPDALIGRDISGRFFEIRLWDGPLYRGISVG